MDVCNNECELNTFAGIPRAESEGVNIDVTIKTRNVEIAEWNVYEEGNSDHRPIIFTLKRLSNGWDWRDYSSKGRFVLRKSDWELFQNSLEYRLKRMENIEMDLKEHGPENHYCGCGWGLYS